MWIEHVAIYGNDINKMLSFYNEVLEFDVIMKRFDDVGKIRCVTLKINEKEKIEIMNFDFLKVEKRDIYVNQGFMHIGLGCNNIAKMREKLLIKNIDIKEEIKVGYDRKEHFFIEDPEKNLIEFTEI